MPGCLRESWRFGMVPGKNTGVGCHFLLQEIFLAQGSLVSPHGQSECGAEGHGGGGGGGWSRGAGGCAPLGWPRTWGASVSQMGKKVACRTTPPAPLIWLPRGSWRHPALPTEADPAAVPPAGGGLGAPAHGGLIHYENLLCSSGNSTQCSVVT